MRWFWGLLILLIGIILIIQNFGMLNFLQWEKLGALWPIILILFGISLIFKQIKFGWIFIIAAFVLAGIFIFYVISIDKENSRNIFNPIAEKQTFDENIPENTNKVKLMIDTGAVELNLKTQSEKLVEGDFSSRYSQASLTVTKEENTAIINVGTTKFRSLTFWGKSELNLNLNKNLPIELVINSGASTLNLNLKEIKVSNLDINAGASTINLDLGEVENEANLTMDVGASSIKVKTLENLGVKIIADTGVSSRKFRDYSQQNENTYLSKDYDQKEVKFTLDISAGASNIVVENY